MKKGDKVSIINTQWFRHDVGYIVEQTKTLWIVAYKDRFRARVEFEKFYKRNNLQKGFSKEIRKNCEPNSISAFNIDVSAYEIIKEGNENE